MTVKQLIETLAKLPEDLHGHEVRLQRPAGDYWGTILATALSQVREEQVRHSDYHDEWCVEVGHDGTLRDARPDELRQVVVLS